MSESYSHWTQKGTYSESSCSLLSWQEHGQLGVVTRHRSNGRTAAPSTSAPSTSQLVKSSSNCFLAEFKCIRQVVFPASPCLFLFHLKAKFLIYHNKAFFLIYFSLLKKKNLYIAHWSVQPQAKNTGWVRLVITYLFCHLSEFTLSVKEI